MESVELFEYLLPPRHKKMLSNYENEAWSVTFIIKNAQAQNQMNHVINKMKHDLINPSNY